jgi:integrase
MPRNFGEGSVLRSGDKRWFARLRYTDCDGRRAEKKRIYPTKAAARAAIADLRAEIENELSDRKSYRQLDEFYRREYVHAAKLVGGKKVSGFRQDLRIVKGYLDAALAYFSDTPLDAIRFANVEAFANEIRDRPVVRFEVRNGQRVEVHHPRSVADVNQHLRRLRRVLNVAVEQGWMTSNPFKHGRALILDSHEVERMRVLTQSEEDRLLAACHERSDFVKAGIIFAIETGLRLGELKRVQWRHIDLKNRLLRVEATTTKTLKPRMVPITARLVKVLTELRQKPVLQHSPYVFNGVSFRKAFETARNRAGLEDLHFHDLRHTAITRMLEQGITAPNVMKISGHTQHKTFMRYVNQTEEGIYEIAMQLDARRAG